MNPRAAGYWAITSLLAVGLFGSGMGAITQQDFLVEIMKRLGYPTYMMPLMGSWYVSAAVVLMVPGFTRVKEWAYAGIVFAMTGAFVSHAAAGDPVAEYVACTGFGVLGVASYLLRPANRRLTAG